MHVEFSDGMRRLDILTGPFFPWGPAKIALVDRPPFLTWPHVEPDGFLCALPSSSTVNSDRPDMAIRRLLREACQLVEDLIGGNLQDDFDAEFLSYWSWGSSDYRREMYSLCAPDGETREVVCWRGQAFTVVADTPEELERWLAHQFPSSRLNAFQIEPAALVGLPRPPRPVDFPQSGKRLITYLERTSPKCMFRVIVGTHSTG